MKKSLMTVLALLFAFGAVNAQAQAAHSSMTIQAVDPCPGC